MGRATHISILVDSVDRAGYAYPRPDGAWVTVLESDGRDAMFQEVASQPEACRTLAAWAWAKAAELP